MAKASSFLVMTPHSPNKKYRSVKLGIAGDATFNQVTGSGGWQVVERPKQIAATQWYDRSPFQLVIPAIIDPSVTRVSASANQDYEELKSWLSAPSLHASLVQPPTIKISGPLLGTDMTWVVYSIEWKEAIRDGLSGALLRQMLTITLYEYNAPFPSAASSGSPASTARKNGTGATTRNYTVKEGDTLAKIAQHQMKGMKLSLAEAAIVAANKNDKTLKLRSPNQILTSLVHKTIRIPAV